MFTKIKRYLAVKRLELVKFFREQLQLHSESQRNKISEPQRDGQSSVVHGRVVLDSRVGIDSQCVSYIIDAVEGVAKPTDDLSKEKIALFRTYLYMKDTLYVTPTARMECDEIRDVNRRATHRDFNNVIFGETVISDTKFVDERANQLLKHHNRTADCRIVAEAEDGGLDVLLTYDTTFLKKMRNVQISVRLSRPSEFWSTLNILPGAKPDKIPHPTHPLAEESWWVV